MGTTIKQCKCASEFQDKIYGKGMRLFNKTEKGTDGVCTVCNTKIRVKD